MLVHLFVAMSLLAAGQLNPPTKAAPKAKPEPKAPAVKQHAAEPRNATSAPAPKGESNPEIAAWLVDLARHQGHLVGRSDPRSASLHVLALLEAAVSVSPDCAEAHYWLYDIYYRMGQTDEARQALADYVRLTPDDDAAMIRHLELELADRQTAEARMEYLKGQLNPTPVSRAYESELHRWLAKHYFERRESEAATTEIEQALRLNPMNVAARQLSYEMFGETEPALQRVEMTLQLIAMNPSQANLVWDLAEFLDRLSLHTYAQEWYQRAIDVHESSGAGEIPPAFWQRVAVSYLSSGDYEKAREATDAALEIAPAFHSARLLRATAENKLGLAEAADKDQKSVSDAYAARIDEVVNKKLTGEAAEIAWFYSYHQPDKDKALKLAKLAMEDPNPSSLARLAYGYALNMNGESEEARGLLEPLSATDQLAALELAKIQFDRDNKGQAITLLHKAATIQYSGIAYQLIADLLKKNNETPPQPPIHTKVITALDKFPRDVFDYYKRPQDFLKFTVRFANEAAPPTGPIDVVFKLANVGPFAVTFGEGFMARPLIAVSARVSPRGKPAETGAPEAEAEGDQDGKKDEKPADTAAVFNDYLQVLMNSRTMLMPGETLEKTVSIDVGPIREYLIRNVTQTLDLEVTAVFDPVYENGKLVAGAGTIKAEPAKGLRPGVDTSPQAMEALLSRANSTDPANRAAVADILGALRADAETNPKNPLVQGLPMDDINTALATLLTDEQWPVRAHATTAVGWAKLDTRVTSAAAREVRDAHPVVKLLAVRLFAQHHGEKFTEVLKHLSKADPSPFVRTMAESYLPPRPHATANRDRLGADDPAP